MTPHFKRGELMCNDICARAQMSPGFLQRLESLRVAFGKPMIITSGYRCPRHNSLVSKTGIAGPHTTGLAVDVSVAGPDAYLLVLIALQMGFTGIGVQQAGPHVGRIIHIDDLPLAVGDRAPRPRIWSY